MVSDEDRQRLIVKQSAIKGAIEILRQQLVFDEKLRGEEDEVLMSKVFLNAKRIENWVFGKQADIPIVTKEKVKMIQVEE